MKVKDKEDFEGYLSSLKNSGFQATNLGRARDILKKVLKERANTTIYLSFTANLIASSLRGYIKKMIENKMVDVIITTAGALEHDLMKSFYEYEIRSFNEDDIELHNKGDNRIGNIIVKSKCYELLEKINFEVFEKNMKTTPSKLAYEYGRYISEHSNKKEDSFLYHSYKNNIPVFCPGIVDGAIGLNAYFFRKMKKSNKGFEIDVVEDLDKLGDITLNAEKTAGIVIGGGISKHHLIGSNIIRGGLDYAIYLTTALEWDGSLSGAKPKEAVSWGKIKENDEKSVVVYGDATINLPLLLYKLI